MTGETAARRLGEGRSLSRFKPLAQPRRRRRPSGRLGDCRCRDRQKSVRHISGTTQAPSALPSGNAGETVPPNVEVAPRLALISAQSDIRLYAKKLGDRSMR